jgi:hypothetical protein
MPMWADALGSVVPGAEIALKGIYGGSDVYKDSSGQSELGRWINRFGERELDLVKAERQARKAGTAEKPASEWKAEQYMREWNTKKAPENVRPQLEWNYRMKARYEVLRDLSPIQGEKSDYEISLIIAQNYDEVYGTDLKQRLENLQADGNYDENGAEWTKWQGELRNKTFGNELILAWQRAVTKKREASERP